MPMALTAPDAEPFDDAVVGLSGQDLARVINVLPLALVLTTPQGEIEIVNQRAERMFGYAAGELRGRQLDELLPPRFRSLLDLRQGVMTNACSPGGGKGWALWGLNHDGTEFPLEIDVNPIELDRVPMLLANMLDLTARHATERDRQERQRELERTNADLEEFAYAASHDLKAPLRAIAHLVQWISEDTAPTASRDTTENLRLLEGRVARLQLLLDGLLDYSRIGRNADPPVEDVDVAELVKEIVALQAPPPGFAIACEGDMPVMRTHRPALLAVLANLLNNAVKHHDRSEGHVSVSAQREEGVWTFRVTDDGPGIPPQYHDRIFVIFQTLAARDEVESSGIGLAIVKKRVTNHGGQIRVESAPPARGTSFVFTWKESVA